MTEGRSEAEFWIERLRLEPLPLEGGHYRETIRSRELVESEPGVSRSRHTAIYFLLTEETFSAFHRLRSDEVYHFYAGDPVELVTLDEHAGARVTRLGNDFANGETFQALVPRGVWQGSRLVPGGRFALLGTTVVPGFDFADFELGSSDTLLASFPSARPWIERLTP